MEAQSPASVDSRRKRRRYNSDEPVARRASETASSTGELGSMRRGQSKGSSSFVGSGSGIYFVHTVQAAFARNQSRQGSESLNQDLVPGEDDRLNSRTSSGSIWTTDEVAADELESPDFSFDEMVALSQPYFDNWHRPFPFLLGSSVLALFEKLSLHDIETLNHSERIIVRSILSISLADRRQMPRQESRKVPPPLIFSTVDEAISSLTPLLVQPSTLTGLQALVAIQIFLVSMLYLNAASRVGGLIIRIAFHLGLHRCPSKYEQFTVADVDLRKRVFWTIYTVERYLSQSLGLPVDLKDDDIDVCYPDQESHPRQFTEGSEGAAQIPDPRVLLLPSLLARHGKIRGLTLELRHIAVKSRVTDSDEVAQIEAEISKWWNEAQDLLDPHFIEHESDADGPAQIPPLEPSHKLLLIVQKHESIILLNRPVISSGQSTPMFAAAMQKCIGASKQIVSKVYQHLQDGQNRLDGGDGRLDSPLFWPGFTWCIWMSGLILMYAAAEGHYSLQIAQKEAERCIKILESLSLRGSFWPGACATALRDLQKALQTKILSESSKSNKLIASRNGVHESYGNKHVSAMHEVSMQMQPSLEKNESFNGRPQVASAGTPDMTRPIDASSTTSQPQQTYSTASNSIQQVEENEGQSQISYIQNNPGSSFLDYGVDSWQQFGLNQGPLALPEGSFQGFNDIFQLMDVSYQMSEQLYDPNINSISFSRV